MSTTGFRLSDYGIGHECYGCPYVLAVKDGQWNEESGRFDYIVRAWECRASQKLRYHSYAALTLGSKNTGAIYSLDLSFLKAVQDSIKSIDGVNGDSDAPGERGVQYGSDGLYRLPIQPEQNKKGIRAKQQLFEMFFTAEGLRKDVAPDQEKQIVLKQIEEAKAMGKINIANINAGMNKVKTITESLSNISHSENVPIDCIKPSTNNPYASNDTDDDLKELAMSIQTNGLINPLAVNKVSDTEYQIISGERRYKAISKNLTWKTIPCTVFDHISYNAAQLKLHIANLDVREYTTGQKLQFYTETDRLLRSMKESGEFTGAIQQGIAELLGVSDRQVRKYKTITENLSSEQQQSIVDGSLSINDACKLTQTTPVPSSEETPKTETSSAFNETGNQQPVVARRFKYRNNVYFVKADENNPDKFCAYFKSGNSEDIPLGSLPSSYDTFFQAQDALSEYAASRGYEEFEEPKTGTGSGFDDGDFQDENHQNEVISEPDSANAQDSKNQFWCDKIKIAIRQRYDINKLYQYYVFQVPTTQDAIKEILKPTNGYSGGSVDFSEKVFGFCTCRSSQMEIEYSGKRIVLSFSQVDDYVRKMIRSCELLSKGEIRAIIESQLK